MASFFLILFWFGVLFTVTTFLLGHILSIFNGSNGADGLDGMDGLDGIDIPDGADITHAEFSDSSFSDNIAHSALGTVWGHLLPFKVSCIAPFCAAMGGVGYILLRRGFADWAAVALGVVAGWGVAVLINSFVLIPLARAQNTAASNAEEAIGREAVVIETIPGDGFGKISYVVRGNQMSAPARSQAGYHIDRGATVRIEKLDGSVHMVTLALRQKPPKVVLLKSTDENISI